MFVRWADHLGNPVIEFFSPGEKLDIVPDFKVNKKNLLHKVRTLRTVSFR